MYCNQEAVTGAINGKITNSSDIGTITQQMDCQVTVDQSGQLQDAINDAKNKPATVVTSGNPAGASSQNNNQLNPERTGGASIGSGTGGGGGSGTGTGEDSGEYEDEYEEVVKRSLTYKLAKGISGSTKVPEKGIEHGIGILFPVITTFFDLIKF